MPIAPTETKLDSAERRRFAAVAAIWLAVLILPYIFAWLIAPPGWHYSGLLYNPDDQNVHLSWARQASENHLFLRDLFTAENLDPGQRPLFINLFASAIGVTAAVLQCPLIFVYHAFRLVFAVATLWFFANLCALLTPDKRTRFVALLLAAFSGGAGYLHPLFAHVNFIDRPEGNLMVPEAFTFTSALVFPLFVAATALLLFTIWQTEIARREARWKPALAAAVAALLLGNIHTYDIVPLDVLLGLLALSGLYGRYRHRERGNWPWLAPLIAIAGTLPPFFYQLYVFHNSNEFQVKALTVTAPPKPFELAISFAPLLLLAIGGIVVAWWARRGRMMLLWLVVVCSCIYAPVSFGRKMLEGIEFPLCFLAACGLSVLLAHISERFVRRFVLAGALCVLSISSFRFVGWCMGNAIDNNRSRADVYMPPLYLADDDMAALAYLKQKASPEKAILCLPYLGDYIPRETGKTAYIGHWAETLHFYDPDTREGKIADVGRFFGTGGPPMTAPEAMAWLHTNHIGSVVLGHYENVFSAKLPLTLPTEFKSGDTIVYAVPG